MKIFIIGDRKKEYTSKMTLLITDTLEKIGQNVDKSLIKVDHKLDYLNFDTAYKRNINSIRSCDVIVAEISGISSGIGFLLAKGVEEKKPVIALFNKESKNNPSLTLKGINNRHFHYYEYTAKSLENILKDALDKVKKQLDTKFILIIPSEIDRYLEWASDYKRMHKAQVVREAIEKYMEKDEDWKEYLASE